MALPLPTLPPQRGAGGGFRLAIVDAERAVLRAASAQDVDVILNGDATIDEAVILRVLVDALQGDYTPTANAGGFVDFQLTRGLLGVST